MAPLAGSTVLAFAPAFPPRLAAPGWRHWPARDSGLARARPDEAHFRARHGGGELDLPLIRDGRRGGVEFKRADAPRLTPTRTTAMSGLALDALYGMYAGARRHPLADRV